MQSPSQSQWCACKRVLRYIKSSLTKCMTFKPATWLSSEGYSDADWACDLVDRKSITRLCVMLGFNLLTWGSKKQKEVSRSSKKSEYRSLFTTATELVWIASLLHEIGISLSYRPKLWCDNQGAQHLLLILSFTLELNILKWTCIMFRIRS